jgi:short subunit dehydrogenase-like uncharacterized protein
MAESRRQIAVFGATGYTGGLVAHELRRHGAPLLLSGRNPDKLRRLAAELGEVDTTVADARDRASLDALAQRTRVIINCVGPFVDHGEPVVRAAIAAGAHYVDTTGEQRFLKAMLVHDTWAKRQEVAVIPALAFEIAVSDCAADLAAAGMDEVETVTVIYATRFHASQGTKRTGLRVLQSSGFAWVGGEWIEEVPGCRMTFADLPEPIGRVAAVSFPSAEVITIPRHVAAREVRAYLALPRVAARVLSSTGAALAWAARSQLGGLLARFLGDGTAGPDEATRRRDTFHVVVDADGTRRGKPARQRVIVRGRDPYGLTAAIARQGALLLSGSGRHGAGVLAPAAAFDPKRFLDGLQSEGVRYEVLHD